MMLSTLFLVVLSCTLYNESYTLRVPRDAETRMTNKLEDMSRSLSDMKRSLQELHEKSNNWAIVKHNVDAWNSQLRDVDQKLTLIRRSQEEEQHKLTSLELTLNHVLSKVVFLSDSDVHGTRRGGGGDDFDLADHTSKNKSILAEISARLNNVLRHLDHQESTNGCHNPVTQVIGTSSEEKSTKRLEQKLNVLLLSLQPKDVRQMQALVRKHAKTLEHMHLLLKQIAGQQRAGANNLTEMTEYCQSAYGELTTFTESSDLLLKRIEMVVNNVHLKLRDGALNETHMEEEDCKQEAKSEECDELLQKGVTNLNDENGLVDEQLEEVEYVQPAKADCNELEDPRIDGIYKFLVPQLNEVGRDFNERFCAFATDGPAWTVVQKRAAFSIQENFNRSWDEYRAGFGSLSKDFWFGNEYIHKISYRDDHVLRIELEDFDGVQSWAEYGVFRLDSESYNYQLLLGEFNGSMPDALEYHNKMDFSTYDRKNDHSNAVACAVSLGSGWWFNSCMESNLNGIYHNTPTGHKFNGIIWEHWHQGDYSLKTARMMIRPRNIQTAVTEETYDEYATNNLDI